MTSDKVAPLSPASGQSSLYVLAIAVLRRRRVITALGVIGAAIGLVAGLTSDREYTTQVTFIPQSSQGPSSEIAIAASQFGLQMPTSGVSWGPPTYVELLHSPTLLEPIALDTVTVAEEGGRRAPLWSLLDVRPTSQPLLSARAIRKLSRQIRASEDKKISAVKFSVSTRWPSVSLYVTQRLIAGLTQFNKQARQSQARAERQSAESLSIAAERALRVAEDQARDFLQQNHIITSAGLKLELERLQRQVAMRQELYTTLMNNREQARIREIRDTPVITMLGEPRLPVEGDSRRTAQKIVLGGVIGGMLAVFWALIVQSISNARRENSVEASEFFRLAGEATPRLFRRAL